MAIARVQAVGSGTKTGAATTTAVALTSVGVGNALIVCISEHHSAVGTVTGVSDTKNVYTKLAGAYHKQSTTDIGDVWYCKNVATGGSLTVTTTFSVSGGGNVIVIEVSGQDAVTFVDQVAGAVGSSTAPNSGATPATISQGEFVVGLVSSGLLNALATAPTFSTSLVSVNTETLADNSTAADMGSLSVFNGVLAASAVAETFSATQTSDPWVAICATFLPFGSGPCVSEGGLYPGDSLR